MFINKINGKVYIGKSKNIYKRYCRHLSKSNPGTTSFSVAMRKYGINNFDFFILETCRIEDLDQNEVKWISLHNSTDKRNGYNITIGGSKYPFPESSKQKMSETKRCQNLFGDKNHRFKKRHSQNSLIKMSTNRKTSSQTYKIKQRNKASIVISKKPVIAKKEDKEFLFDSINSAANFVKGHRVSIRNSIKNKKLYLGYEWSYQDKPNVFIIAFNDLEKIVYSSWKEIKEKDIGSQECIRRSIREKTKYLGYNWQFEQDGVLNIEVI